jgi:hypothetical protein
MAIAVLFRPRPMSTGQYDDCIRMLEEAGAGHPSGRLYHACYEGDGGLNVFDVWESKESFESFGPMLMPILQKLGINPGEPAISQIHNVIA